MHTVAHGNMGACTHMHTRTHTPQLTMFVGLLAFLSLNKSPRGKKTRVYKKGLEQNTKDKRDVSNASIWDKGTAKCI